MRGIEYFFFITITTLYGCGCEGVEKRMGNGSDTIRGSRMNFIWNAWWKLSSSVEKTNRRLVGFRSFERCKNNNNSYDFMNFIGGFEEKDENNFFGEWEILRFRKPVTCPKKARMWDDLLKNGNILLKIDPLNPLNPLLPSFHTIPVSLELSIMGGGMKAVGVLQKTTKKKRFAWSITVSQLNLTSPPRVEGGGGGLGYLGYLGYIKELMTFLPMIYSVQRNGLFIGINPEREPFGGGFLPFPKNPKKYDFYIWMFAEEKTPGDEDGEGSTGDGIGDIRGIGGIEDIGDLGDLGDLGDIGDRNGILLGRRS